MCGEAPKRIWLGCDERDYHPVFLSEEAAGEHGWNDADGAKAPVYIRRDTARKVKPLVWGYDEIIATRDGVEVSSSMHWDSDPRNMSVHYSIIKITDTMFKGCKCFELTVGRSVKKFETLEAAKAAAQADYERRILSALEDLE